MAVADTVSPVPAEGMLTPFRALDLTEGGCAVGGKTLGDLGADVIQIEPPGGSSSRGIGPFLHGDVHPEKSLFWMAYNCNKRGITLEIATADGAAIFRRLVETADFVLESYPPGYMDGLGLGYGALSQTNPRLIVASITPFGQSGPKAHNAWSDLTVWASGGTVFLTGDQEHPPLGVSFMHQATLNGGAEAAAACMIAHHYRQRSGLGQHIDLSMQAVAYGVNTSTMEFWETEGAIPQRSDHGNAPGGATAPPQAGGSSGGRPGVRGRQRFYGKDGIILWSVNAGPRGAGRSSAPVVDWMREEGAAPDWLSEHDWDGGFDLTALPEERFRAMEEAFADFIGSKTGREIMERGISHDFVVGVVNSPKDIGTHPQLQARDFFHRVANEGLGEEVVHCGPPVKASETPLALRRPAPRIGEHNAEVYGDELGLTTENLVALMYAGVI